MENPRDTDEDGIIDALDEDSDNDGVSDKIEREQGTDYRDDADKPETLSITLNQSSIKLGLGLRDINITIGVSDMQEGDVKLTVINNQEKMFRTTQQWSSDWLDTSDYDGEELMLTLKGLKVESGLITIELTDRLGNSKTEDISIEVIEIADFVENRREEQMTLDDANTSCYENAERLPTIDELKDAYHIDNPFVLNEYIPIWSSTEHSNIEGNYYFVYGNDSSEWSDASEFDINYVHCVKKETSIAASMVAIRFLLLILLMH
jgi:hypothetical protein